MQVAAALGGFDVPSVPPRAILPLQFVCLEFHGLHIQNLGLRRSTKGSIVLSMICRNMH